MTAKQEQLSRRDVLYLLSQQRSLTTAEWDELHSYKAPATKINLPETSGKAIKSSIFTDTTRGSSGTGQDAK